MLFMRSLNLPFYKFTRRRCLLAKNSSWDPTPHLSHTAPTREAAKFGGERLAAGCETSRKPFIITWS